MTSRAAPRVLTLSQRAAHSLLADATTTTSSLLTRSRTHVAVTHHAHAHAPPSRLTPQRRFQHTIPRFTGRNPFSANPAPQDGESTDAASNTTTSTTPPENSTATTASNQKNRIHSQPHYQLTFTCVPCGGRSKHAVSKQGYHHGSVLITCPDCRNRHVISDHLGVFGDRKGVTVEDLMRDRGLLVKKGTLGEDGSIEFWEDDLPGGGAAET